MSNAVQSSTELIVLESRAILKGRLMKFEPGFDWSIPKEFKGGKVDHIGDMVFLQEKYQLHTSKPMVTRVKIELFHDLSLCPYYPFEDKVLTYITHIDGPILKWDKYKDSYMYWVQAVNPEDGHFFFLLTDCDVRVLTSNG